jgi:hypothetical protein
MTQAAHQPLVPLADRPFASPEYEDSQQQTIWFNPTSKDAVLNLQGDTPKPGRKPRNWEERTGQIRWVIKAGETKAIPSHFDRGIQQTQCSHLDCLQRPFDCKSTEEGHEKQIVGGFGPQLINKGTQKAPIRPGFIQIAPALDDVLARQQQAEMDEFREFQRERLARARREEARAEGLRATEDGASRDANKPPPPKQK